MRIPAKRHQHNVAPVVEKERRTFKGVVYDSLAESVRAAELDLLVRNGDITHVLRQVPFMLGGVTYRADFVGFSRVAIATPEVWHVWVEEVTGRRKGNAKKVLLKKLWRAHGPFPLKIYYSEHGRKWDTIEEVLPNDD